MRTAAAARDVGILGLGAVGQLAKFFVPRADLIGALPLPPPPGNPAAGSLAFV